MRAALLAWYGRHRRLLPWRATRDPYRIWLSEIMLQQTRVNAVLGHYRRFLERFPDVGTLARARASSVLTAWSGLGYYRRARALHAAARVLVRERGGEFPRTAEGWRTLPGVGRYTAAAIASIAFGEPEAVLDGNVQRVLSRLRGGHLSPKEAWGLAAQLLDRERSGDFNQAMMELGATVCLPGEPECGRCPLARWCRSRGALARAPQPARHQARLAYRLALRDGAVRLRRRPARASLMPGMWELPAARPTRAAAHGAGVLLRLRHSITTTDYQVEVRGGAGGAGHGTRWVPRSRLAHLPLTGLARKILQRVGLLANPMRSDRRN
ncbi:MAG TPA: A/G-specific adenine glycosylase [Terriglobales bacterium]|nr:A/G-specific adenine glycosylase [Terriglobales bacterium]